MKITVVCPECKREIKIAFIRKEDLEKPSGLNMDFIIEDDHEEIPEGDKTGAS